ncbi:beach domain-containing protein [Anaeramoeba flamelloides]|uniref:Beach domain-containing protein n=1 Tax=Anaeramoeba flamelloides TaxID=1746091 RepID=A0ABQ8Y475_9EUKA|nr:beach domain-containing protein [Anaeramoeba flamelloides]
MTNQLTGNNFEELNQIWTSYQETDPIAFLNQFLPLLTKYLRTDVTYYENHFTNEKGLTKLLVETFVSSIKTNTNKLLNESKIEQHFFFQLNTKHTFLFNDLCFCISHFFFFQENRLPYYQAELPILLINNLKILSCTPTTSQTQNIEDKNPLNQKENSKSNKENSKGIKKKSNNIKRNINININNNNYNYNNNYSSGNVNDKKNIIKKVDNLAIEFSTKKIRNIIMYNCFHFLILGISSNELTIDTKSQLDIESNLFSQLMNIYIGDQINYEITLQKQTLQKLMFKIEKYNYENQKSLLKILELLYIKYSFFAEIEFQFLIKLALENKFSKKTIYLIMDLIWKLIEFDQQFINQLFLLNFHLLLFHLLKKLITKNENQKLKQNKNKNENKMKNENEMKIKNNDNNQNQNNIKNKNENENENENENQNDDNNKSRIDLNNYNNNLELLNKIILTTIKIFKNNNFAINEYWDSKITKILIRIYMIDTNQLKFKIQEFLIEIISINSINEITLLLQDVQVNVIEELNYKINVLNLLILIFEKNNECKINTFIILNGFVVIMNSLGGVSRINNNSKILNVKQNNKTNILEINQNNIVEEKEEDIILYIKIIFTFLIIGIENNRKIKIKFAKEVIPFFEQALKYSELINNKYGKLIFLLLIDLIIESKDLINFNELDNEEFKKKYLSKNFTIYHPKLISIIFNNCKNLEKSIIIFLFQRIFLIINSSRKNLDILKYTNILNIILNQWKDYLFFINDGKSKKKLIIKKLLIKFIKKIGTLNIKFNDLKILLKLISLQNNNNNNDDGNTNEGKELVNEKQEIIQNENEKEKEKGKKNEKEKEKEKEKENKNENENKNKDKDKNKNIKNNYNTNIISNNNTKKLLKILVKMSQNAQTWPSIEFHFHKKHYFSNIEFNTIIQLKHTWPPEKGYTISLWIKYQINNEIEKKIQKEQNYIPEKIIYLFRIKSKDNKSDLIAFISKKILFLKSSKKKYYQFSKFNFQPNKKYHIVITHTHHRYKSEYATLFVNGLFIQSIQINYPKFSHNEKVILLGSSPIHKEYSGLNWKLGMVYLFNNIILTVDIFKLYLLGSNYTGIFLDQNNNYTNYNKLNKKNLNNFQNLRNTQSFKNSFNRNSNNKGNNKYTNDQNNTNNEIIKENYNNNELLLDYDNLNIKQQHKEILKLFDLTNFLKNSSINNNKLIFCFNPILRNERNQILNPLTSNGLPKFKINGDYQFIDTNGILNQFCKINFSSIFYLIENSKTSKEIYLILTILQILLKNSYTNQREMERINGYQVLGLLLKMKIKLIKPQILQILLLIAGFSIKKNNNSIVSNQLLFKSILLNFEIWKHSSTETQLELFNSLSYFFIDNDYNKFNFNILRKMKMIEFLVFVLKIKNLKFVLLVKILDIFQNILQLGLNIKDLKIINKFIKFESCFIHENENEKKIILEFNNNNRINNIDQMGVDRTIVLNLFLKKIYFWIKEKYSILMNNNLIKIYKIQDFSSLNTNQNKNKHVGNDNEKNDNKRNSDNFIQPNDKELDDFTFIFDFVILKILIHWKLTTIQLKFDKLMNDIFNKNSKNFISKNNNKNNNNNKNDDDDDDEKEEKIEKEKKKTIILFDDYEDDNDQDLIFITRFVKIILSFFDYLFTKINKFRGILINPKIIQLFLKLLVPINYIQNTGIVNDNNNNNNNKNSNNNNNIQNSNNNNISNDDIFELSIYKKYLKIQNFIDKEKNLEKRQLIQTQLQQIFFEKNKYFSSFCHYLYLNANLTQNKNSINQCIQLWKKIFNIVPELMNIIFQNSNNTYLNEKLYQQLTLGKIHSNNYLSEEFLTIQTILSDINANQTKKQMKKQLEYNNNLILLKNKIKKKQLKQYKKLLVKEEIIKKDMSKRNFDLHNSVLIHGKNVKKQFILQKNEFEIKINKIWKKLKRELIKPYSIFYSDNRPNKLKYKLALTNGYLGMRKKLIPNYRFVSHYCYTKDNLRRKKRKKKKPIFEDTWPLISYKKINQNTIENENSNSFNNNNTFKKNNSSDKRKKTNNNNNNDNKNNQLNNNNTKNNNNNNNNNNNTNNNNNNTTTTKATNNNNTDNTDNNNNEKNQTLDIESGKIEIFRNNNFEDSIDENEIYKFLNIKKNSQILIKVPCLVYCHYKTQYSVLIILKHNFFIIDNYQLSENGKFFEITNNENFNHKSKEFLFEDLVQVLTRRKYGMDISIEFFFENGESIFLIFANKKDRNDVFSIIMSRSSEFATLDQKLSIIQEDDQVSLIKTLFKTNYTAKWSRGEISNFEYLLKLNILAGRSFNDLTQYPVFPWILRDYDSEELDLNDPNTFRNLSKPMGALDENRLKTFQSNYKNWTDPIIDKFMYGSHYSSPGVVLHYTVRLEPFSTHSVELQGGKFDSPGRLFQSLSSSYKMSSSKSTVNVKELIPEFFYLPEIFTNHNDFFFGTLESTRKAVHDVKLPKWANNSPDEFIRLHRKALESDYVSENLHHWIDLIFGYKQRGQEAVKANNVFYYLTYEGVVDLDKIKNPRNRVAIINQIDSFGQCPKKLFNKPHPQRKFKNSNFQTDELFLRPESLKKVKLKTTTNQIGYLCYSPIDGEIVIVGRNKLTIPPKFQSYVCWNYPDRSLRILGKDLNILTVIESPHFSKINTATISTNGKWIVTGGDDQIVTLWKFKQNNRKNIKPEIILQQRLFGHDGKINCVEICLNFGVFISGSDDKRCIIWDLYRANFIRSLEGFNSPIRVIKFNNYNGNILTLSDYELKIWSLNGQLITETSIENNPRNKFTSAIIIKANQYKEEFIYITGQQNGKIKFWSLSKVEKEIRLCQIWSSNYNKKSPIKIFCYSKNQKRLYFTYSNSVYYLTQPENGNSNKSKTKDSKNNNKTINCNICNKIIQFENQIHYCKNCGTLIGPFCCSIPLNRNHLDSRNDVICINCAKSLKNKGRLSKNDNLKNEK